MSAGVAPGTIVRELQSITGPEHVIAGGRGIPGAAPVCTVRPGNAEEVAAVIRAANRNRWAVVPAGGYTRQQVGGPPARLDVVLEMTRLTAIGYGDPGDLTIRAEAGARIADVLRAVTQHAQLLPLDPAGLAGTTVGGTLATAAAGPLAHRYGTAREFCLGIEFVTGDGVVAKAGGRVVKNVAGYDLMKLLIGSFGTLGLITAANFKLVPAPRGTRTFLLEFATAREMLAARNAILRSPLMPLAFEMISAHAEQFVTANLNRGDWTLAVQAGGSEAVLSRYGRELNAWVTQTLEGPQERQFWHMLRDFPLLAAQGRDCAAVQVSVARSEVGALLDHAERCAVRHRFFCALAGRAAGALTVVFLPNAGSRVLDHAALLAEFQRGLGPQASCYVLQAPPAARDIQRWQTPIDKAAMLTVRDAMDPRRVLNPGRFVVA